MIGQLDLVLLHHCDQMVDGQCHGQDMPLPLNLDQHLGQLLIHDQPVHTQVSVKVLSLENLLPMELLPEF